MYLKFRFGTEFFSNHLALADTIEKSEYDIDLQDETWIKENNIPVDQFEKAIELLERFRDRVPALEDLTKLQFLKQEEAEAIFDYWLDKCLTKKSKLMVQMKMATKQRYLESIRDPYVAFRKCPNKINTRKNRAQYHANYVKLLDHRRQLASVADYYKGVWIRDKQRGIFLKDQLRIFEDQYRSKNFSVDFQYNEMNTSQEYLDESLMDVNISEEKESDSSSEDDSFTLKRQAASDYYKVRSSYYLSTRIVIKNNEFYCSRLMISLDIWRETSRQRNSVYHRQAS